MFNTHISQLPPRQPSTHSHLYVYDHCIRNYCTYIIITYVIIMYLYLKSKVVNFKVRAFSTDAPYKPFDCTSIL